MTEREKLSKTERAAVIYVCVHSVEVEWVVILMGLFSFNGLYSQIHTYTLTCRADGCGSITVTDVCCYKEQRLFIDIDMPGSRFSGANLLTASEIKDWSISLNSMRRTARLPCQLNNTMKYRHTLLKYWLFQCNLMIIQWRNAFLIHFQQINLQTLYLPAAVVTGSKVALFVIYKDITTCGVSLVDFLILSILKHESLSVITGYWVADGHHADGEGDNHWHSFHSGRVETLKAGNSLVALSVSGIPGIITVILSHIHARRDIRDKCASLEFFYAGLKNKQLEAELFDNAAVCRFYGSCLQRIMTDS